MNIPKIAVGDRLELKKKHPCGASVFEVLRVGSDIRIVCAGCGRDLVLPREKLEKYTPDDLRAFRRQEAVAAVKARFGNNAVLKGIDLLPEATGRERNRQIGGHKSGV